MSTALQKHTELPVEQVRQMPTIEEAFQKALTGGIAKENLEVAKELLKMHSEMEFHRSFSELQKELPVMVADTVIPNRGKYKKFEDIMNEIQPYLTKHGFSVSFENDFRENAISETCVLRHGGFSTRTPYWTRRTNKADSDTQADSKTATTARRNALIRALNLVIRQDILSDESADPRQMGTLIEKSKAAELQHRLKMVNGNEKAFLKLAGVESDSPCLADYEKILSGKLPVIEDLLRKKEGGK